MPGGRFPILLLLLVGLGLIALHLWERLGSEGGHPRVTPVTVGGDPGRGLYAAHCAVCHGPRGKGDGQGARLVWQSIRDFSDPTAMRQVNDRFLFDIIKKGGSQFGRSNAMPAWGMKFSDEEIHSLVTYIRSLARPDASGPPSRKDTP